MMQINGKRSLVLLLVIPVLLLVQLGIGFSIYTNIKRTSVIESNNNKLDLYLRTNTKFISNGESAQRGYLLTGDSKFLETYKFDLDEWKKNEAYYDSLSPEIKRPEVNEIQSESNKKLKEMELTIRLYNSNAKDSALDVVRTGYGKILMDTVRSKSTFLRNKISAEILAERNREYELIYAFFAIIAVLIALSLFITWITYQAFTEHTHNLEKTVASLEEANARMMKYNYNSYHSLKTPLRNITGFMQLLGKKYDSQLDNDAKEYVGYVTDGVKQLSDIIVDMRRKYLEQRGPSDERDEE